MFEPRIVTNFMLKFSHYIISRPFQLVIHFCCHESTQTQITPLAYGAWSCKDSRNKISGRYTGVSLFPGNYRTMWKQLDISQCILLTSILFRVKGKHDFPRGLMKPDVDDGTLTHNLIQFMISFLRRKRSMLNKEI